MSSEIANIEVYPDYDFEGKIDYTLPFSYGCLSLDLMGYLDIDELIKDIREKLLKNENN